MPDRSQNGTRRLACFSSRPGARARVTSKATQPGAVDHEGAIRIARRTGRRPLHPDQRQRHGGQDPHLRRDHPVDRGPRPPRHLANVTLGFDNLADYVAKSPYFGCITGRYANRIALGKFTLDGVTYQLPINNAAEQPARRHRRLRQARLGGDADPGPRRVGLELDVHQPGRRPGLPGHAQAEVTYTLTRQQRDPDRLPGDDRQDDGRQPDQPRLLEPRRRGLRVDRRPRPVLNARHYTPVDPTLIPTGAIDPVAGTPMDFTRADRDRRAHPRRLRAARDRPRLRPQLGARPASRRLADPAARRAGSRERPRLEILTDQPGIQFYSGNFLDGTLVGTSGRMYRQGDGLALETQHFPTRRTTPNFPSTVLRPGQGYQTTTVYQFSTSQH